VSQALAIDFLESFDDASVLIQLQRIGELVAPRRVTKDDLEKHGRVSYSFINRRFGSLRHALQRAELDFTRFTKATDEELLQALRDLWVKTLEAEGRRPLRADLRKYGVPVSGDTIIKRFSTWRKALVLAANLATDQVQEANIVDSVFEERIRKTLSLRTRFFVLQRDGFTCVLCGANGIGVRLEVDHLIPWARGGSDQFHNLQTLCFDCNRGKRDSLEQ